MTKRTTRAVREYRVANPRGLPAGRWILRVGERRWFEGDAYDGPITDRWLQDGFIVPAEEVTNGEN